MQAWTELHCLQEGEIDSTQNGTQTDGEGERMNRELYIHTLRMLREQYEIARMDTVVETIDAALAEFERPTDSDCISRQAAIDAVRDRMGKGETNIGDTFIECFEMILNALPSAQPEQQWIPCSETEDLPEHEVLCCDRYGEELIGWLSCEDDQWLCESDGEMMYDPIAWREKPEPWRGEEHGET